jgi:uncharacterized protein VirK/YbjX
MFHKTVIFMLATVRTWSRTTCKIKIPVFAENRTPVIEPTARQYTQWRAIPSVTREELPICKHPVMDKFNAYQNHSTPLKRPFACKKVVYSQHVSVLIEHYQVMTTIHYIPLLKCVMVRLPSNLHMWLVKNTYKTIIEIIKWLKVVVYYMLKY